MSDQKKTEETKKKLEQIYENFGLDMEDMDTEEIERLVDFYSQNKEQLDKAWKKSVDARRFLPAEVESEEEA
jgi:L-fucose isomerase-like protein